MAKYLLFIGLALLFFSCSNNKPKDILLETLKENSLKTTAFDTIFDADTLHLEATDSTLLTSFFSFMVLENKIYVANKLGGVFAAIYDTSGVLIKIFARKGAGPNEILSPKKFVQLKDMIVIPDGSGLNFKFFDRNGDYLFQQNFTTVGFKDIASDRKSTIVLYHGQPGYKHPLTIYDVETREKIELGNYNPINKVQSIFEVHGVCFDRTGYFYVIFSKEGSIYKYRKTGVLEKIFTIPKAYFDINNADALLNLQNENEYRKVYIASPRLIGIYSFADSLLTVQIEETMQDSQSPTGIRLVCKLLICTTNGKLLFQIKNITFEQKIVNSDGEFLYSINDIDPQQAEGLVNPSIVRYRYKGNIP